MDICSIILSAGKGNRMLSDIPKPLHTISGKSMLQWVIDANKSADIKNSIVVIPKNNKSIKNLTSNLQTVLQPLPLGTGDAVKKAMHLLKEFSGIILVCFADTPFINPKSLRKIINAFKHDTKLVISGFKKDEKNNYGKIIFSKNNLPLEIIEQKDTRMKDTDSNFCNGGIMAIHSSVLHFLNKIEKNLITNEYYLTDLVKILNKQNKEIAFIEINEEEILGVNDQIDLSIAEKIAQTSLRKQAMLNGVKLIQPDTVFFNFDTKIGKNVTIHPNVVFGKNVNIEASVEIKSFSHIEDCVIQKNCVIGPFARIRGQSILGKDTKIGNFVEIKKSNLDKNVKVSHLSYVGDSEIGTSTNIGAGTITCNYDGKNKNITKIGKNSFIGSNSTIIAPIVIGDNVTLGAGSVFNKDVPDNNLSLGRARQINKSKRKKIT
ncbi:bifunctional UDP-N-acetylglucosamine diphosphorylase/glucosamine-1-phosphate N-acetyltransferase GlmU [Alphaproteobacteria bacterium]|nr:bifunctional UDP-N-acetylglucosamine diphosphorylase/glucosamine-1-phosphate N-acetyltransferase GlmU [Alphaproteobacteria bacterium]